MQFTRTLKRGMSGDDILYMKQKLFELGYYPESLKSVESKVFSKDTVEAVKKYQTRRNSKLQKNYPINGVIDKHIWNAIEEDFLKKDLRFTRNIELEMSGKDVVYVKESLLSLGYYPISVTSIEDDVFDKDTVNAIKSFQEDRGLEVDGTINRSTWRAIEKMMAPLLLEKQSPSKENKSLLDDYNHIDALKRKNIEIDLLQAKDIQRKICLEALNYVYDNDFPSSLRALYIFGENLYDENGKLSVASVEKIKSNALKYPGYFNAGRKEWMIEQVKTNGNLPMSDCSGLCVGCLRKHGLVASDFNGTIKSFLKDSVKIDKSELKPGDWVFNLNHMGIYVGAQYVVEFYGGAQACQLTHLEERKIYDFIAKKLINGNEWTDFRRPKYY